MLESFNGHSPLAGGPCIFPSCHPNVTRLLIGLSKIFTNDYKKILSVYLPYKPHFTPHVG